LGKIIGGGLPVGALTGRKEILEKASPERKVNKWERVMVGGGTFSSHPLTTAAGLAMLRYIKDHEKEIYPYLEDKGQEVREGVRESFHRVGINAIVTGIGSLFQTHFPFQKEVILNSPHTIHHFTDIEKREIEFRIRMLNKGVHVMHGGGGISMAHSDEDLERIIKTTGVVAKEMANEMC
jgi:glutamate-1-semialdehyde 2,1-aminomutase